MMKQYGKGGKNQKRRKNEGEKENRIVTFKEDRQEYAQVNCMLDDHRCDAAICINGTKRICHMRGEMFKTVRVAVGDIVLVSLRANRNADVILKYMPDEARLLKAYGELPANIRLNEVIAGGAIKEDSYKEEDDCDYVDSTESEDDD